MKKVLFAFVKTASTYASVHNCLLLISPSQIWNVEKGILLHTHPFSEGEIVVGRDFVCTDMKVVYVEFAGGKMCINSFNWITFLVQLPYGKTKPFVADLAMGVAALIEKIKKHEGEEYQLLRDGKILTANEPLLLLADDKLQACKSLNK